MNLPVVAAMFPISGCILRDELTTVTIRPDGTADWIRFISNVRSSESIGARELLKFIDEFESHSGSNFVRIGEAGGEVLESRWIEPEEPYSTLVKARFPTVGALVRFWKSTSERDDVFAQAHFTQESSRQRLSFTISRACDKCIDAKVQPTLCEFREHQANGISETRIIVTGGHFVASEGFVVSSDRRSCLLECSRVDELVHRTAGGVELFLEWELTGRGAPRHEMVDTLN